VTARGADSPTERSRRKAAAIGMAVVAVASLAVVAAFGLLSGYRIRGEPSELLLFWVLMWSLAGGAAAWVAGAIRRWPLRIVADALLTWLMVLLLFPVLLGVFNLPTVVNGDPMPCFYISHNDCRSGLYGIDAVVELAKVCLEWFVIDLFLLLVWWVPVVLLVPATIWDWLARR
jgi:hypothetical protein